MKRKFIAAICLCTLFSNICIADNLTQISRYTTISNKPTLSQTNLLSQNIQVRFTRNIYTIGDAINYLLNFSGYSLVSEKKMNEALKTTLQKSLPLIDRELGPMSLQDALTTLIGPAFYMTHDPVNRTVNFNLKKEYLKRK